MNILIGENIKRLRKAKNVTQEELAEVFNITPAAVCKWETNETYPDITLLFPLAHYFNVTIDELMGYDEHKIQKEINQIVKDYWDLYFKDYQKAKELIIKGYQKYPNDCYIANLYMLDKAGGNADNDPKVLLDNKDEFLNICDKILHNSNDIHLCLNVFNMQAKILHAEGKTEEALRVYDEKYPNFYHTSNQKKEQLFTKDTKEFKYYLMLNLYELIDFSLNKKMKEIWFCNDVELQEKIKMSYDLIGALDYIRKNYSYNGLVLGQYAVISSLKEYLNRFEADEADILQVLEQQQYIKKLCNELAYHNLEIKNYIRKAYNCDKL